MKTKFVTTMAMFVKKFFFGLFVAIPLAAAMPTSALAAGSTHGILVLASADLKSINCEYVGDVWGTSGWGKASLTVWKHKAEHRAMKMAKEIGASHVYWEGNSTGGYGSSPHAHGKAYRCEGFSKSNDIASSGKDSDSSATTQVN